MLKTFAALILFSLAPSVFAASKINTIDLLWEADTYTPPFYRGHSEVTSQSIVKVVALPEIYALNGSRIALPKLDFSWVKDGRNIGSASGLGKNILTIVADTIGGGNSVSVTVRNEDNTIQVKRDLAIRVGEPQLIIYEDEPLQGLVYERALGDKINLAKPEINLVAEPFFFSRTGAVGRQLRFDWQLNGKTIITDPQNGALATFGTPGEGMGSSDITITAKNDANILQSATGRFTITFGQKEVNF